VTRLKLRKQQPQFTALHTIITNILNINLHLPCITISFLRCAVFQQFAPPKLYSLHKSFHSHYQRHG